MPRKPTTNPITPFQKYHATHGERLRAKKRAAYNALSEEDRENEKAKRRAHIEAAIATYFSAVRTAFPLSA
jgi:hypothetical protein